MSAKRFVSSFVVAAVFVAVASSSIFSHAAVDPATKCEAAKNKLAAKYQLCRSSAAAKALPTGDAADFTKCEDNLAKKWAQAQDKAVAKGGACASDDDLDSVRSIADACAGDLSRVISGATTEIVIFNAGAQPSGNLGNRATTTALCASAAASQALTCDSTVAVLSYTGDAVVSFPATYSVPTDVPLVAGVGDVQIAGDWADFLDGQWDACLGQTCYPAGRTAAGILVDTAGTWTGTRPDGTLHVYNCNEWTDGTGTHAGANHSSECYGVEDDFLICQAGGVLGDPGGGGGNCAAPSQQLLCLCY